MHGQRNIEKGNRKLRLATQEKINTERNFGSECYQMFDIQHLFSVRGCCCGHVVQFVTTGILPPAVPTRIGCPGGSPPGSLALQELQHCGP
jgi:hypothetical protein